MKQHGQDRPEHALLLVDKNRTLLAANQQAADLLAVAREKLKGKPIGTLANGALMAIALRPNGVQAMTVFEVAPGRSVLATTQPVTGRNNQFLGWVVTLRDTYPYTTKKERGTTDDTKHTWQL